MLNLLLLSGSLALISTVSGLYTPALRPSTQQDLDAALLAPIPNHGIKYTQPIPKRYTRSPHDKRARDRFQPTENWTPIHSHRGSQPDSSRWSAGSTALLARNLKQHHHGVHENITSLSPYGTQYGVQVTFGTQPLVLTLDTGSADTWAVAAGSNCTSASRPMVMDDHHCLFGPAYAGGFPAGPLPDVHLYVAYGDGEVVQGPLGAVDVSVAGLRVANQTVGLANDTRWWSGANNMTSGILGLAYPGVTSAYEGSFGDHQTFSARPYAPVFASMVDQGLVDDFFSIALGRSHSDGVLAFGGVPEDLEGVDYGSVAMTDIIIANVVDNINTASDYSFYTIIPDGWFFGTASDDRKVPYIIDTGTSFIYLPTAIATAINNAFNPPAEFSFFGGYFTSCDAVPPRVGIAIDGQTFWLDPQDLILREVRDPLSGLCMTTVGDGGAGPFVLGDVFLRNVLAVFDVGDSVMQFAGRKDYM